jgi:phosphoglycerate dehydrogenase-like enzyme
LSRPTALFLAREGVVEGVYGPDEQAAVAGLVDLVAPSQTPATLRSGPAVLERAQVIMSSWGMPTVDGKFLSRAPALEAIFYAAGSVKAFATPELWARGVRVTCAQAALAKGVADYACAAVVLGLKGVWRLAAEARRDRSWPSYEGVNGAWGATAGVVSLGFTGRLVAQRLASLGVEVLAFDPFVAPAQAEALGVKLTGLEDLFSRSQAVSVHAPLLPATEGMVTGALLRQLPWGAVLVNTARSAVVRQDELIEVLGHRPDLTAVLDVTTPEPLPPGSPLFSMHNIVLTPHIAGTVGHERRRLGQAMVRELRRYVAGEPLKHEIDPSLLPLSASP